MITQIIWSNTYNEITNICNGGRFFNILTIHFIVFFLLIKMWQIRWKSYGSSNVANEYDKLIVRAKDRVIVYLLNSIPSYQLSNNLELNHISAWEHSRLLYYRKILLHYWLYWKTDEIKVISISDKWQF